MFVAHGIGEGRCFNIVDTNQRRQGITGFVFKAAERALVLFLALDREVFGIDPGNTAAADGAGETSLVGYQVGLAV